MTTETATQVHQAIMDMKPRTQVYYVLLHLVQRDHITQVEAHELYRVYRLASRINDLKNLGIQIVKTRVKDLTGRLYVRYSLA